MRQRKSIRIITGLILCVIGFVLAKATPFRENTFLIGANGCRMVTNVVDNGNDQAAGFVVLLHGLSANKKIMSYLARAFAVENLRVFVPDLPGHGRTQGPFWFSRAESCSQSFVRELAERRAIDPARTIVVGHSMGGAIAELLPSHSPLAGVIAISPAPMSTRHGIARYLLPFENAPTAPANTLVISGSWEPVSVRNTARDFLEASANAASGKYVVIPHATHVSLLFDPAVARACQDWAAKLLALPANPQLPSRLPLLGSLLGFAGILLLAGPFIRETVTPASLAPKKPAGAPEAPQREPAPATFLFLPVSASRATIETLLACLATIALLHFWRPLSFIRLYDGDYFASFLLIVGLILGALHYKSVSLFRSNALGKTLAASVIGALLLFFLISAWFDATLTAAWLPWFRWLRFPAFFIAAFAYLGAEELLLASANYLRPLSRNVLALALRVIGWLAILLAILVLHRGPILLFLLAPYFFLLSVLQLAAVQLVRIETRSFAAATLFGAILLAGFCLVIFPVT